MSMSRPYRALARALLGIVSPYHAGAEPPGRTVIAFLRSHLAPLRKVMILSVLVTVLAAALEVWLIGYAGRLIDQLTGTPATELWALHGWELTSIALMILFLRPCLQLARRLINDVGLDCNIATLVRWRAHTHLAQQSVGWFQSDLTGRTASRLVDIGNHAATIIYESLNILAFGLIYMVGIVTLMASTDIRLALPLFLWLALYVGLLGLVIPRMIDAQRKFQGAKSALLGGVVDSFSNFDTMKLFASRDAIEEDHKAGLEVTRSALFRTREISVALRSLIVVLEGIIMVGFVGYGIWLWSMGAATIGLVSAAMALSLRITAMAEGILDAVWRIVLAVGSMREALKTVGQPISIPEKLDATPLRVGKGGIKITGLRHHYGLGEGGLDGLDLTIHPGEKVGIVGPSGAGKSTLVNLILLFYQAEAGRIEIDGQDISNVDQDSLRNAVGMVSQQAALLNRSIRDNIALGRDHVSDRQVEAAAREAQADDFIRTLSDNEGRRGYDAHVGERGIKLSGGQRQRLALARVILKNAPILILDEATSALDSEAEARIQTALEGVMRDKTVIAIAHRLSTIAEMDRIVVLEAGRIVEIGSHAALLKANGRYASFWARQSGGFLNTDGDVSG